jgi:hypothetical protein
MASSNPTPRRCLRCIVGRVAADPGISPRLYCAACHERIAAQMRAQDEMAAAFARGMLRDGGTP